MENIYTSHTLSGNLVFFRHVVRWAMPCTRGLLQSTQDSYAVELLYQKESPQSSGQSQESTLFKIRLNKKAWFTSRWHKLNVIRVSRRRQELDKSGGKCLTKVHSFARFEQAAKLYPVSQSTESHVVELSLLRHSHGA